jgi:uncharacterized protein (DUF1778 family)
MPTESTASQPITARIPNRVADELRKVAATQNTTVSHFIATAVARRLRELQAAR